MISPGSFIGNYRILSPLSSDAVSQVFLTENASSHGSPVALCMWNGVSLTTPQERDAFLKEVRELIKLRHPYIVSTLDAGIENEHPYLVSEYIYSNVGTLQDRIQRQAPQPFSQVEALNILSQIGQALSYAHQQNILHRQLAPGQIVFNTRGEAVLGNFGLATIQESVARQFPGAIGQATDPFQAPEQQRGALRKSKLGDQYSLGSIAYALLTGYIPMQPAIAPTQRNSFLPVFIERAILKAMSSQPIERYPNVNAFLTAVGALPDEGTLINHSSDGFPPLVAQPTPLPAMQATPPPPVAQEQMTLPNPYMGAASPPSGEQRMGQVVLNGSGTMGAPPQHWANTIPPAPAAPMAPTMAPRPPINNKQNKGNRTRRALLIALGVILLLALTGLGAFAYTLVPSGSATVTLTPSTQHVSNSGYTVTLVSGQADATQGQVAAHNIAFSAKPQTKTVPATGKGHQNATAATGILTFSNVGKDSNIAPNQALTSNSGVQVITDGEVVIKVGGTATVSAHVATPGAGSNIGAFDVNNTFNVVDSKTQQVLTTVTIQNTTAFTGGQDASDFIFVQQSDIDGVSNPLVPQMTSEAQSGAQQQVGPNEKLVSDLKCSPVVTSNNKVNAHATTVTVQVTVKCVGEAYTDQALQAMAITLLKADATQKLGSAYALAGNVITATPVMGNVDPNGTATFSVKADSIWAFQFSDALKQQMAQAIAGKSVADSTTILQKFTGISKVVSIQTSGFGGAVPSNSQNITFNATSVAGL